MSSLQLARAYDRFELFHTYDILLYLLEAIRCESSEEPDDFMPDETSAVFTDRRRWQTAWDFLRSEQYVSLSSVGTDRPKFSLSTDGWDLLEDLRLSRTDPHSTLSISEEFNDLSLSTDEIEHLQQPTIRKSILTILEAPPAPAVHRRVEPSAPRHRARADVGHAAAYTHEPA